MLAIAAGERLVCGKTGEGKYSSVFVNFCIH